LHRRLGVSRAVIVQASCHGADNRAMLDAIAAAPGALRGVAVVDETFDEKALRALHEGGVRGVRFNFVRHLGGAPDKSVFESVLERVASLGWHVVLHLDAEDIVPMASMIAGLKVPTVIDHMGRVRAALGVEQPAFRALLGLLQRKRDLWVKVSGAERIAEPPFRTAIPFAERLIAAAPDRVLWGTDFPHPNLAHAVDEADLVDLLADYGTPELVRALLVDNPACLYGF
jgi:predicted TIM-barrel fold metal-dependent hydrolase